MFAIKTARAFDGEQQLPGGATLLIDDGRIAGIAPAAAPLPESCASSSSPMPPSCRGSSTRTYTLVVMAATARTSGGRTGPV
jgi:hypothetical protein